MRIRASLLLASAALLLAFTLPQTTVAASSYGYAVIKNVCSVSGGAYGHGKNVLQVQMHESGYSGIYYFRARAREQVYAAGTWQTIKDWGWTGTAWNGVDAGSHSWTYGRRHDFTANQTAHQYRMLITMQFGNGTAYPYVRKAVSKVC